MKKYCIFVALMIVGILGFTGIAQADLNDGLVAYYPFNGNADDESGNGNDGTVNGATLTEDRFGNVDSAYSFDGNEAITFSDRPNLTESYTYSIWISVGIYPNTSGLILHSSLPQEVDYSFKLGLNSYGGFYFKSWGGGGFNSDYIATLSGGTIKGLNSWQHIAIVRDGLKRYHLYVDGELYDSHEPPHHVGVIPPILKIGHNQSEQDLGFVGQIDDLKIYNRALSESEIQELYNKASSGVVTGDIIDSDNDGVIDIWDNCPDTPENSCTDKYGCSCGNEVNDGDLGDCPPCADWKNHGEYVSCTTDAVHELVDSGQITEEEGDAIISSAAKSNIGKKGFVPEECQ